MLSLMQNRPIRCHILHQIRNDIAFGLELAGIEGNAARRLRPDDNSVINVIIAEVALLNLLHGKVLCELVHNGGCHLQMCQLLSTQRSNGYVPLTVFWDGHGTVGFPIHSFSTFERIKKYDENKDAGNVGKPYSIEVRDTERTITIYGIASTRFDIAG